MAVLAGVVASLALVSVLLATASTPGQAQAERAVPDLPPPTMAVTAGPRAGVWAVPLGAIVTDRKHRTWVSLWIDGARSRRVAVHEVGTQRTGLVEVTGAGLRAGALLELVAEVDADEL